jgi:hypothetical protein
MPYHAYGDESYISAERYRAIGIFSFPAIYAADIRRDLEGLLTQANVSEFKWNKVSSAKYRFCALALIKHVFENLAARRYKVDVLVWDTQDARHAIQGRDDERNFERMFFHLLKNAMKRRGRGEAWHVFPDEKEGIDWATIGQCLQSAGRWQEYVTHALLDPEWLDRNYILRHLEHCISHNEPSCQLADLFTGLAVFSRRQHREYLQAVNSSTPQHRLFPETVTALSAGIREKSTVLSDLDRRCKAGKLGVSLRSTKGLETRDPKGPINFWLYRPQHLHDRAPMRQLLLGES